MKIIDFNEFRAFPVNIEEVFPKGDYDLSEFLCRVTDDTHLSMVINKAKNHYIMDFILKTRLHMECARCLTDVFIDIDKKERAYFFDSIYENTDPDREMEEDELDYYYLKDMILDLFHFINELLIISIPDKALCKADCSGLCSVCGNDLNKEYCKCSEKNIDPRWEALKLNSNKE